MSPLHPHEPAADVVRHDEDVLRTLGYKQVRKEGCVLGGVRGGQSSNAQTGGCRVCVGLSLSLSLSLPQAQLQPLGGLKHLEATVAAAPGTAKAAWTWRARLTFACPALEGTLLPSARVECHFLAAAQCQPMQRIATGLDVAAQRLRRWQLAARRGAAQKC